MSRHDHDDEDLPDEDLAQRIEEEVARATGRIQEKIERELQRDARRAERAAEREERRSRWKHSMDLLGGTLTVESGGGREETEEVERRFEVSGSPKLRVRNVSGVTAVRVGQSGEVQVRARKRVRGWSEDRAKRLLENVEIRMEQRGDEIVVEPTLYQQERGWLDLFRGGRVTVDLDISVPRESQVDASTVSGPLTISGTRGPLEARAVSGEIEINDVQGPMRLGTVSGDVRATEYAGHAEANSTSGDLRFERSRIKRPDIVTVSGDVRIDGALLLGHDGDGDARIKTISGDIDLELADAALELDFNSLSGDLEVDLPEARVEKRGRREWHVRAGEGGPHIRVKTVSGDLNIGGAGEARPAEAEASSEEPMPQAVTEAAEPQSDVLELLRRVAKGEVSVEDAATTLDKGRS